MARAFDGCAALLFIGSAALTATWCGAMSGMPGMEMPGGWTMSMTWMRMPGQSWAQAAAGFLGMWGAMMVAMMLPAVAPALRELEPAMRWRVAAAYFGVWLAFGAAVYPLGLAVAELEMRVAALSRLVPILAGAALLVAGILQLSDWKARQLDCCRTARRHAAMTPAAAWHHGAALGLRCCACCAPLTAALLVVGIMDLGAMAGATVAITLERLAAQGRAVARFSGSLLAGAGVVALARGLA